MRATLGLTAMLVILALLLAPSAWPRHIIEGPIIEEIAQATQAVNTLDRELSQPNTTPERQAAAQSERSGRVGQISSLAASNPQSAPVNLIAADSLLRVQEPAHAEVAAERVITNAPQNPDGYLLRARARMDQGRFEDAATDFKRTLSLRPGDPAATAGLKLTEGRTSSTRPSATPIPTTKPAEGTQPAHAPALSEHDRKAAETRRIQQEYMAHYNASVVSRSAGEWDAALDSAKKALALDPTSPFLKNHLEDLAKARAATENPAPVNPTAPVKPVPEPKRLGASNPLAGMLHYLGRSERPRRVQFSEVDTTGLRITSFPQMVEELRKPPREGKVKILTRRGWSAKGLQSVLIGRFQLVLRGTLTDHGDCRWSFDGSLRAMDDIYNFEESDRDFIPETLTTIGRNLPGKDYPMEIRGFKVVKESGMKENCP